MAKKKSEAWRRFDKNYAKTQKQNAVLKAELRRHNNFKMLNKLLDCRVIDKFDGELGVINKPIGTSAKSYFDIPTTVSLLKSGAIIHHNIATQNRAVILNGKTIGYVHNNTLRAAMAEVLCHMETISGTNIVMYKAV